VIEAKIDYVIEFMKRRKLKDARNVSP
jgi:hypothetical protein